MKVFGLTGKTGAGKSTVAKALSEMGFYIIDGDIIARNITKKGKPALKDLAVFFGSDIIDNCGNLNRKLLAERAFKDGESTKKLNKITHPRITEEFKSEIEKAESLGFKGTIIDAAALLESDCKNLCEKIIVVTAPEEIRLKRILKRDSITPEQAKARMNAQKEDEYYLSKAHIIVRNYPPHEKEIEAELKKIGELINEN